MGHTGLEGLRYAAQIAPAFADPTRPIPLQIASNPNISLETAFDRLPTSQSRRVSSLERNLQNSDLYTDLPKVHPNRLPRDSFDSRDLSQLSRGGVIDEMSIDPQAAWFSILEASPDVPANYRNAMMRISRIVDPMGEAAARYLALSQAQPVARQIPTPQQATFLDQSEEYRRKARALREKRHAQGESRPSKPVVKTVEAAVSDDFLRFVFQRFRDAMAHARTPEDRAELQKELQYVKKRIANDLVKGPRALKSKDGYIIIGDRAYGTQEAYQAALMDLDYFQTYGHHLPLKYPVRDYRPGDDIRLWPDVTDKVDKISAEINNKVKKIFDLQRQPSVLYAFLVNFRDNAVWDSQVNYGLPGQIAVRDSLTGQYKVNEKGYVLTIDQYASFKGKIRKAGYISNYIFGRAAAAADLFDFAAILPAQAYSVIKNRKLDQNDDLEAIIEGYKDYRDGHPLKLPNLESFKNK